MGPKRRVPERREQRRGSLAEGQQGFPSQRTLEFRVWAETRN